MKVLLKSVTELMAEGYEFDHRGRLGRTRCNKTHTIDHDLLYYLGTTIQKQDWYEGLIKEHIKEEKTYSLSKDFDYLMDDGGQLLTYLKGGDVHSEKITLVP